MGCGFLQIYNNSQIVSRRSVELILQFINKIILNEFNKRIKKKKYKINLHNGVMVYLVIIASEQLLPHFLYNNFYLEFTTFHVTYFFGFFLY